MNQLLPIDVIDSTKITTFQKCPRKFLFEYVLGWQFKKGNHHLGFGIAIHKGLETLWKSYPKWDVDTSKKVTSAFEETFDSKTNPEDFMNWKAKTKENGSLALQEYMVNHAHDFMSFEPVLIERAGQIPTSIDLENFITVKIDTIVRNKYDGKIYILEHKTAGQTPMDIWDTRLQIIAYYHALNMCYGPENVGGIYVDTIILYVPTTKAAKDRMKNGGFANGFERSLVTKTNTQMADGLATINMWINQIKHAYSSMVSNKDPNYFPKCSEGCYSYGSRCQFYNICATATNPLEMHMPMDYVVKEWNPLNDYEHFELPKAD